MDIHEKITAVASYLASKPGCLAAPISDETLRQYVAFHMLHDQIKVCWDDFGACCGVVIAWQRNGLEEKPFAWEPGDPAGDSWWWDQIAADDPQTAMALVIEFVKDKPWLLSMAGTARRNGKIRQYKPWAICRELDLGMKRYVN